MPAAIDGGRARLLASANVVTATAQLLIHGALRFGRARRIETNARKLQERRHPIPAVAFANKNALIAWALLSSGRAYDPGLAVGSG